MLKINIPLLFCVIINVLAKNNRKQTCEPTNLIYSTDGDLKVGLLINDCRNTSDKSHINTYINAAIFTRERINSLEYTKPFKLGLSIFEVCNERDYYKSIFELFKQNDERFLLGIINLLKLPAKIDEFCNVLDVPKTYTTIFWLPLVKSSIKLLNILNWKENVTVISSNRYLMDEFHRYTRREWICVKKAFIFDKSLEFLDLEGPAVIFGNQEQINYISNKLLNEQGGDEEDLIFVPFDGLQHDSLPVGSYIISPPLLESTDRFTTSTNLFNTPLFFEIANPIVSYVKNISKFITENCNSTLYKYNCLFNKLTNFIDNVKCGALTPNQVMQELNLQSESKFNYNIYQKTNTTMQLDYVYNMFYDEITIVDNNFDRNETNITQNCMCAKYLEKCIVECVNFKPSVRGKEILLPEFSKNVRIRTESWVFAFLSISFLGCLLSFSILIYLLVRLCKRDTFEGNPVMTLLLVVTVICMYCAIIPYALEGNKITRNAICVSRSLSLTLTFAFAFSLLLSRSILLATVSNEIGFMSHISGPVQAFLCLFIFGIQCALSLQVVTHCSEIFRGYTMLFLLSYNIILLLLLVLIAPLITKTQRNYKEGKYFTVSILLIACSWCCWIPSYALLDEEFKDPILCLGLVSTASIFLGVVFIPRTYLITIATARDRLTSNFPSLGTANSTLDMYRANAQPVYDCVNIAAINAANKNSSLAPPQQADLYSCPTLPEEDNFDIENCDSPSKDKITRF